MESTCIQPKLADKFRYNARLEYNLRCNAVMQSTIVSNQNKMDVNTSCFLTIGILKKFHYIVPYFECIFKTFQADFDLCMRLEIQLGADNRFQFTDTNSIFFECHLQDDAEVPLSILAIFFLKTFSALSEALKSNSKSKTSFQKHHSFG